MNRFKILLILLLATQGFAACVYQDCAQVVAREQALLQYKLKKELDTAEIGADLVAIKYNEQLKAIEEENKVLEKLEALTIRNNALLKAIELESQKAAELAAISSSIPDFNLDTFNRL